MPPEIDILLKRVDEGFRIIFEKIDLLQRDFSSHLLTCANKFAAINTTMAVDKIVMAQDKEMESKKRDWWKWIIRSTIGAIASGIVIIVWRVLSGSITVVVQ